MSDTAPRNAVSAPRMLADALLRSVSGGTACLRLTGALTDSNQSELGIVATDFAEVVLSPALMRRLRPTWKAPDQNEWELLLSATSVAEQVRVLELASAEGLFAMALGVRMAGRDYLIESIAANEAFGQVYLYRLLLREAGTQAV